VTGPSAPLSGVAVAPFEPAPRAAMSPKTAEADSPAAAIRDTGAA
jgi:hypothetical protein